MSSSLSGRMHSPWRILLFIISILGFTNSKVFAQLSINFSVNDPSCFALPNGSVVATAAGGLAPYSYVWDTGQLGSSLPNIGAGTYSVTATDTNGESISASVTLTQPDLVTVDLSADDLCSDPFDISATPGGGVPPYGYNWNTGTTTQTITNVSSGTYCVTVVDDNNCGATDCITVNVDPPSVSVAKVNVTCPGGSDGSLIATPIGGLAPFTYLWNTGATSQVLLNIPAGTYSLTLTDANGCMATGTTIVSSPPEIEINTIISNPGCAGDMNGSITTNVSGGTPPYSYEWSNGAITPNLFNLAAGTYSLTLTDANDCVQLAATTLFSISNLIVGAFGNAETCPGENDGFLTASSTGGVLPLSYLWSNGATTQVVTDVSPGSYTLTIIDALGCTGTATTTVAAAPDLMIELTGMDISTCGAMDGSVMVNVISGTGPFTYIWNTGATTTGFGGLVAGTYSVTVTAVAGCSTSGSVDIIAPPAVSITTVSTNLDCLGQNTGTVTTTVNGGTAPFSYLWNTGATTANLINVGPGNYSVTLTDVNGCTDNAAASVTAPPMLMATITGINLVCFNDNSGSIDLSVNGGTAPYSFVWNNGATTEDLSGLPAASYTATVTDANGCTATQSISLNQPPALSLSVNDDAICLGQFSGQLMATSNGGTPPYSYLWSNGQTTETALNLGAGNYSLTITDANNCTESTTAVVQGLPNPTCSINVIQESTLGNNGILEVQANGGQSPYTYLWNTGATTAIISGLVPGSYSVTISDENACQTTCSATLAALAAIGDYVWEDLNVDGQQDDNEPAVSDITVYLKDINGLIIDTTLTDTDGLYLFSGLTPGTYSVQFVVPDGYAYTLSNMGNDTTDNDIIPAMNGMTGQYTLSAGEVNLTVDAGIYLTPVPVVGDPCNCLDNATNEFNGQFQEIVTITSYAGQVWTITDQMNLFSVNSPAPPAPPIPVAIGTVIPEISPSFYELEFRLVDEQTYFIEFTNGVDTFSFTNTCIYPTISINELPPDSLCVFDDIIPLSGTSSIPGVITFTINGVEVTEIDPSVLLPGNNELLASLIPVDPDECIGVLSYQFLVITDCDAKVGDFVWLDGDRDGLQDPDEPGISGVTVTITSTDPATPYTDISETDNLGLYCFNVPPGTYKVTFDPPTGFFPSLQDQGTNDSIDSDMDTVMYMTIPVTVGPNETNLTLDGGFYPKCDNVDDPGEIGFDQVLCGPGVDPDAFVSLSSPTGGSGELEYLWMMTTGNPGQDIQFWTPIPNTNAPTYDPGPLFQTTYFTRCVRRECCLTYLESNILTISFDDDAVAIIDGPQIVCEGETVTFTAVGAENSTDISWQFGGGAIISNIAGNTVSVSWGTFGVFQVELFVTENGCTSYATQNITVSSSPGACGTGLQIDAEITDLALGMIKVSWEMENLFHDLEYTVEYAEDGIHFSPIAQVSQASGEIDEMLQFEFVEQAPRRGRNYYRVSWSDGQGLEAYSNTQEIILINDSNIALLYPNPVKDILYLELLDVQGEEEIGLEVFDLNGRLLQQMATSSETQRLEIDLSAYPAGAYFLRLRLGDTQVKSMKVLKQ